MNTSSNTQRRRRFLPPPRRLLKALIDNDITNRCKCLLLINNYLQQTSNIQLHFFGWPLCLVSIDGMTAKHNQN